MLASTNMNVSLNYFRLNQNYDECQGVSRGK